MKAALFKVKGVDEAEVRRIFEAAAVGHSRSINYNEFIAATMFVHSITK